MKLLQRATLYYAVVFLVLLLVLTGLFFGIIQFFFLKSLDKSLLKEKNKVEFTLSKKHLPEDMIFDADEEVEISEVPRTEYRNDSYHTIYYTDEWDKISGVKEEDEPHRELITYIHSNGNLYKLAIRKSMIESEDLLWSVLLIEIVILVVLMGSFLLVNIWISRRLWQPFYSGINKIKAFNLSSGNELIIEHSDIREFEDLNQVLRSMSVRLKKDYLLQKQFTENASHELQTPLMVIRSRIELLIQQPDLREEQVKLLQSIDNACLKLSHINKALLLLSKIENKQFSKKEKVYLKPLVLKVLESFQDRILLKSLTLATFIDEEATMTHDSTLIEILFTNLIQNSIRHNFNGGDIQITIRQGFASFVNTGDAPDFEPEQMFERFRKSGKKEEGTGLGLAIVREICKSGSVNISYQYETDKHTIQLVW
ncbi:MAG: HAMP domain-containing histidine kinase [Bacteroidetes bacterium]|nr:HAMP domain-containing histidine kinase [Bacteroidota bacterium]MBL0066380.1 HAMP domain-containing histidine kinase [Bacteroidota bacterium]MBL0138969.1 HAMP domain-containing histidine kinase [Bacteroidota bacterium]